MLTSIPILRTQLFYISDPIVNMREHPTYASKVVSQAFFSEKIVINEEKMDWVLINSSDGYSGWIPCGSFIAREMVYDASLKISRLAAHIYEVPDIEYGSLMTLPYGAKLQLLDAMNPRWMSIILPDERKGYIQAGDVVLEPELRKKGELVQFSRQFLGLPYTWGGRSSFGYDCSGFIQMLYQRIGIDLQRDSYQQVLDSRFQTIMVKDLESGDLIFFGKSKEEIRHVGMYIGNRQLIHTTAKEHQPWLRISHLSDDEWSGNPDAYYPYLLARQLICNNE